MRKTERCEFVMTKAESDDLRDKAERAYMPMSQLIRLLIAGYQPPPAPDERFFELMERLLKASGEMAAAAKDAEYRETADLLLEQSEIIKRLRVEIGERYLTGKRSDMRWR